MSPRVSDLDPKGIGHPSRDFDALELGRLTWLGLAVATVGWVLLIGAVAVADAIVLRAGRAPSPSVHGDVVSIAMGLIGSGFALAVIGCLQTGFSALNRFFGAVLTRSSQRPSPPPPSMPPVASVVDRDAESLRERRPYQILGDGSVEVDTILGTRRFATMHEARDFI